MGVMVPTEKIVQEAIDRDVDIVGLSGLITPSLEEMVNVAREMDRRGMNMPLLIGGATTSSVHTAVKIEPAYSGPVIHVKDASKGAQVVGALMSAKTKEQFVSSIQMEYQKLRDANSSKRDIIALPLEVARAKKFTIDWSEGEIFTPTFTGIKVFDDFPINEIIPFIDWTFFFNTWQLTGSYTDIETITDTKSQASWLERFAPGTNRDRALEALQIWRDAWQLLQRVGNEKMLTAKAVIGIFPANSAGDDIEVYQPSNHQVKLCTFRNIREQQVKPGKEHYFCLSDFVAPKESGLRDYIGAFAVTAGHGIEKWIAKYEDDGDIYNSILLKALADRLAEALAELMHYRVRREFWGYAPEEAFNKADLLRERYQGIRPALGYPACPDHSEKRTLFDLLKAEQNIGINLTEHFSMYPAASVSGIYLANPRANYFGVGKIERDQVQDLANRKGIAVEEMEKWIPTNLAY